MTTRFFTQDTGEQFYPPSLVEVLNELGQLGVPFRAFEWNTQADYYGIAITTDPDLTPEQAYDLHTEWQCSDYDPAVLA